MEIQSRIGATWTTLRKLDLLWGRSLASVKWEPQVYDAVIVSKLLYGLTSIPLTRADCNRIDAFQMRGLRKILKIKHPYWSRVSNDALIIEANQRLWYGESGDLKRRQIERLSQRLIKKQIIARTHFKGRV